MSTVALLNDIQAKVKEKDLPQLLKRDFVSVNTDEDSDTNSDSFVRVMQWNMLAQGETFLCRLR